MIAQGYLSQAAQGCLLQAAQGYLLQDSSWLSTRRQLKAESLS
jgi:hypothetical protein